MARWDAKQKTASLLYIAAAIEKKDLFVLEALRVYADLSFTLSSPLFMIEAITVPLQRKTQLLQFPVCA